MLGLWGPRQALNPPPDRVMPWPKGLAQYGSFRQVFSLPFSCLSRKHRPEFCLQRQTEEAEIAPQDCHDHKNTE